MKNKILYLITLIACALVILILASNYWPATTKLVGLTFFIGLILVLLVAILRINNSEKNFATDYAFKVHVEISDLLEGKTYRYYSFGSFKDVIYIGSDSGIVFYFKDISSNRQYCLTPTDIRTKIYVV